MGICPLCFVIFACATRCNECDVRLLPICACGAEWQSEEEWAHSEITTERVIHRLYPNRCSPFITQREALA